MSSTRSVAVFARDVDPLLVSNTIKSDYKLVYLVEKQSAVYQWVSQIVSPDDILAYTVDASRVDKSSSIFERILHFSNIKDILKNHGVGRVLTTEHISPLVNQWANDSGVRFIGTDYGMRLRFENKIWFDNFMRCNNIPKPDSTIATLDEYEYDGESKIVAQDPESYGGEGTYFINSAADLQSLRKIKREQIDKKFLFRQYIEGISYGITVFVSPSKFAVSPLRIQCFYPPDSGTRPFAGIQWVDDKQLSVDLKKNVLDIFTSLGSLLYNEKFLGYANIDFIASPDDKIYVIECNPRFSAATTHIVKFSNLLGNIDSLDELISADIQSTSYNNLPNMVRHDGSFRGSYINIDVIPDNYAKSIAIKRNYPYGLYVIEDSGPRYLSSDISQFGNLGRQVVYFSDAVEGEVCNKRTTTAYIWSNYPLYDDAGIMNNEGNKLVAYFNQI